MTADYDIWFRDPHLLIQEMITNPEFKGQFDFTPYKNTAWMVSIDFRTSCQETGHGNKQ